MLDLRKIDPTKAILAYERSHLRWLNTSDLEEVRRIIDIDEDELTKKFMIDDGENYEGWWHDFAISTPSYGAFAVTGKLEHVGEVEKDKLQGWICLYPESMKRLSRLMAEGLFKHPGDKYLEISFARHPLAKPGQMASGIRQLVGHLHNIFRGQGNCLTVTAYADVENTASIRVLEASGFEMIGMTRYTKNARTVDYFFVSRTEKVS